MKMALWCVLGLVFVLAVVAAVSAPVVTPEQQRARVVGAVAAARQEQAIRFFQRRLIRGDEELALDLAGLGLKMRELQQGSIGDAYVVTLGRVRQVANTGRRREMLLTLFDQVEE